MGTDHSDLGAERDKLIRLLTEYKRIKGHDITVVFDGWKSGGHREASMVAGGVRVIYSRLGETADSVIKRMIEREKREWIVVSSDREIAAYAWSCGAVSVPTERFEEALRNASTSVSGDFEILDDYEAVPDRRGNPRRPSKKEKALLRALRKL